MPRPPVRSTISKEESLAELYHTNTKVQPHAVEGETKPAAAYPPPVSLRYGNGVALPEARPLAMPLGDAMLARRSRRDMASRPVPLADVATLLRYAYGIGPEGERAAPSAGGRYPLELYVAALHVDGIAPGLWHYRPEEHALEPVRSGDLTATLTAAFLDQPWVERASLVVLVGAVLSRTSVKYGERGYRLVLLDAGHAMQNLLLAATAMELQATSLGGFLDDELSQLCELDAVDENVIYAVAVGR